jgi:hypothetical protein
MVIEASANGRATMYNLSGYAVLDVALTAGNNRVDTSALPKGVYILKYDGHTVKLIK